jgi:hypothetical protein
LSKIWKKKKLISKLVIGNQMKTLFSVYSRRKFINRDTDQRPAWLSANCSATNQTFVTSCKFGRTNFLFFFHCRHSKYFLINSLHTQHWGSSSMMEWQGTGKAKLRDYLQRCAHFQSNDINASDHWQTASWFYDLTNCHPVHCKRDTTKA